MRKTLTVLVLVLGVAAGAPAMAQKAVTPAVTQQPVAKPVAVIPGPAAAQGFEKSPATTPDPSAPPDLGDAEKKRFKEGAGIAGALGPDGEQPGDDNPKRGAKPKP